MQNEASDTYVSRDWRSVRIKTRPTTLTNNEIARFWELALDLANYPDAVKLAAFDRLVTDFHGALGSDAFLRFQTIIGRAAMALGR